MISQQQQKKRIFLLLFNKILTLQQWCGWVVLFGNYEYFDKTKLYFASMEKKTKKIPLVIKVYKYFKGYDYKYTQ